MKKIIFSFLAGILVMTIPTTLAMSRIFSDVPEDVWYSQAVSNLKEKEIINGYEDGTYKPEVFVNRAELATIINNVVQEQEEFNRTCDKLAVYNDYDWFDELNEQYKSQKNFLGEQTDIQITNGEGCLMNDKFIFMPGQFADGCYEFYAYDIYDDKLFKPDTGYCIQNFTDIEWALSGDQHYVSFIARNGPICQETKGKYYYEKNRVEATIKACE